MQTTQLMHEPRLARSADVAAIVRLVESAYRGEQSRQGWTTEADILGGQRTDAAEIQGLLQQEDSCILVVADATDLHACCHLERRQNDAYFGLFAVNPELQGQGIGKHLLRAAEARAQTAWQAKRMLMQVIEVRTDLIAWYQRHGYHLTDQHSPFPYGDERFGIPKRDDLRFVHLYKPLR